MFKVRMRRACLGDSVFIARWHTHYFDNGWSTKSVEDSLNTSTVCGLIASIDDKCVGCLLWQCIALEAEILTILVAPAFSGQGIATMMLNEMLHNGNIETVFLEVSVNNHVAQHMYQKACFFTTGCRPHYYGAGIDAIMMTWRKSFLKIS